MIKGKIMRFLAGVMCSVMLVTSEGMSGLAYAASVPERTIAEQGITEETSLEEENVQKERESEEASLEQDTMEVETSMDEVISTEEGTSTDEETSMEEDTSVEESNSMEENDTEEESTFIEENTSEEDTSVESLETETFLEETETDEPLEEESLVLEADEQAADAESILVECTIENAYQFGDAPDVSAQEDVPADSASEEEDDTALLAYLYQKMKAREGTIDVSNFNIPVSTTDAGITSEKARNIVSAVLNEYPDLYFVAKKYSFSVSADGTKVNSLIFTYQNEFDDAAFEKAVSAALKTIEGITNPLQKAIILHDYLAVNCEYDTENYNAGSIPADSYTIYGVFVNRTAVCQGYALAYKYLLNQAGISCYMVTSDAMNHAWNLVKLGENYYQVDVTWDDPTWDMVGRAVHTYMFRSDAAFTDHHDWSVTSGSSVVDYKAEDSAYDNAFWINSTSPLILIDGVWYYAAYDEDMRTCSIFKRTLEDTKGTSVCQLGTWTAWGSNGFYPCAYSGLSLINGRLYYNDKESIYSINLDGTEKKTEFTADTTNGYIYGSAYCQGKMYYSLHQDPNLEKKETVLTADISFETGGEDDKGDEEIVELPEAEGLQLVDENGQEVKELTMVVGEQKKLDVKLLPEGSVAKVPISWSSSGSYVKVMAGGVLAAQSETSGGSTVTITARMGNFRATCEVTVISPTDEDIAKMPKVQCGNITISSTGIGKVEKADDTTWNVTIDNRSSLSLSYKIDTENPENTINPDDVSIYYNSNGKMSYDESRSRLVGGTLYRNREISVSRDMTFQVAAVTGNTKQQQLIEGIYTINFKVMDSDFLITKSLRTIPGADDTELVVFRLPETCKVEDIEWSSSDTRIVSIGEKTANGVMIKIGNAVGTVQVTAKVKDHKGTDVYAVCDVRVTKKVPLPVISSDEGAEMEDIKVDAEGEEISSYYWVIDSGGRITLSVKGVRDVEFFYTLDGSNPTENSNRYAGPITITKATKFKAFARKEGYEDSDIVETDFKIGTSKLTISQTSLTLEQKKEKEITVKVVPTGGSKDEVEWSSSNPKVADVETREKIGHRKDEDGEDEEYVIREYLVIAAKGEGKCTITASITDYAGRKVTAECIVTVPRKVDEPIFTPNDVSGNTVSEWKTIVVGKDEDGEEETEEVETKWVIVDKGGTIKIELADGEKSEDVIYYTTDGSKPTTSSKKYTGPIKITKKCTIKAIAAHTGCTSSDVVTMRYTPYDTGMTLSKTSASIASGKKQEISVKKWPTGPVDERPAVKWTSANEAIATVDTEIEEKEKTVYVWDEDEDGNPIKVKETETVEIEHIYIYGISSGKTQIIASYTDYAGREQTAVCNVTVTGRLEITPTATLTEGDEITLAVKKNQTGIPNDEIQWSVSISQDVIQSNKDQTNEQIKEPNVNVTCNGGVISAGMMKDTSKPVMVTVTASVTIPAKTEDGEDIDVEACCEVTVVPQSFKITFVGWNGKTAKEEQVYRNQSATPPLDETMKTAAPKGWTFEGWQKSDAGTSAAPAKADWENVTEDKSILSLYARSSYTITYVTGEKGTNPSDNPTVYTVDLQVAEKPDQVYGNGSLLALKDAVCTDPVYEFAGWYKDGSYAGSPIVEIPKGSTGDLILYAKWIPKNDGMWVADIPDQAYTGKAIKPEIKVYDGTKELMLGVDYTVQYKNNTKANLWTTDAEKAKKPTVVVKGKGNYTSSANVEFKILPKDISGTAEGDVFTADDLYLAYTGKAINPAPVLKLNGKKLKNKTEYGIKEIKQVIVKEDGTEEEGSVVEDHKEIGKKVGKYRIILEGKGNYCGTRSIDLTVTDKILMSKVNVGKIADIEWTGETVDASKLSPKLTYNKGAITLNVGDDYRVEYDRSAVEIGSYEIRFIGTGHKYVGEVVKTFKITGKTIKASNITISGIKTKDYDGTEQTQEISVIYGKGKNAVPMVEGRDYTLHYLNHTNAGKKATIEIQGINGYSGTVKKTFSIKAYSLKTGYDKDEVRVMLAKEGPVYYEKGGVKPEVVVYYGDRELAAGTDYTLKYKNNGKAAKTGDKNPPTITVTGKGNFTGSVNLTFTIVQQDISLCSMTANDVMASAVSEKNPDGLTAAGKYKSTPVLTDGNGKKLKAGTDYMKQYVYTDENGNVLGSKEKIAAGSILTVTVTGTGSYKGEISVSYRVLSAKKSVASAKVTLKSEVKKNYSGEPITISKEDLTVKIGNVELGLNDYTIIAYSNNVKKGTAKVTIQGIGEYGGTKTITFKIQPKILSWKEVTANALGWTMQ